VDETSSAPPPVEGLESIRRSVEAGDARAASRSLLRSVGPRLLRDILGPTLTFYVTWKLTGSIILAVVLGSAFSLLAYRYERRQGRPGAITRLVLAFVVVQAIVGLVTDSATAYLVQPAVIGVVNGGVWLVSVAIGRPLAGVFAREVFPIDDELRASVMFHSTFRHVSLVFGIFFLAFAGIQLGVLLALGIGAFVAVRVVDVLCTLAMVVYAIRYVMGRLGPHMRPATT